MTAFLLDINVLVALFDSAHVRHEAAHPWFANVGSHSWATCPITENGFVRVLSNPAYPTISATPGEVTDRLRLFCCDPGHVFWPGAISLADSTLFDISQLSGHLQITDVYLLGLAFRQGGKLATFDAKIPVAGLVGRKAGIVDIIPTT